MDKIKFEELVNHAFEQLPDMFKQSIDNIQFNIEDYPTGEQVSKMKLHSKYSLLGLYEGIPLNHRGTWYGSYPALPDRITLFQKNIESYSETETKITDKVREVLIHEIGHYFGMTEDEIRNAGY
jgi:predicted Zn-dependent protease with MMP-like domain